MIKKKKVADNIDKSFSAYFNDIAKYKALPLEEEMKLWKDYRATNNLEIRNKIISSNLKFVASVAKNYQGRGLSYSDLIEEGNMGLIKAMDKFDESLGYKTISYSVWWIRQSILKALEVHNLIDGDELPKDFENDVDVDGNPISEGDKDSVFPSSARTDNDFEAIAQDNEKSEALDCLMGCLNDREKIVLARYFGLDGREGMTLEEIGKGLGLTKERVRQIKEKALKKMRSEALANSITSDIYK